MNENEKLIQCLFDFKIFFKRKGHLYFPGKICFPQYFAYAIFSIFKNLYSAFRNKDTSVISLCNGYFDILPTIVQQLYDCEIIVVKEKLVQMANKLRGDDALPENYVLLETYLANEESIINYRLALLESVLNYHECNCLTELVDHLFKVKCCKTKENMPELHPPSSEHYLLFPPHRKINNINPKHIKVNARGTNLWGPLYWNIFHSIAQTQCPEASSDKLIDFIYVLPVTLPCSICQFNYIQKMPRFEQLIDNYEMSENKCLVSLYEKIHDIINYETL